jgi:hypothetical protein
MPTRSGFAARSVAVAVLTVASEILGSCRSEPALVSARLSFFLTTPMAIRVLAGTRELVSYASTDLAVDAVQTAASRNPVKVISVGRSEQLGIEGLFPCGWKRLTVVNDFVGSHDDVQRQYSINIAEEDRTPWFEIWIDNRGRPASTIAFGQMEVPVAASFAASWHFPLAQCAGPSDVTIGGQHVATIAHPGSIGHAVIDTSGSRCYQMRRFTYGDRHSREPAPTRFTPGYFHPLATSIDDFLHDAPFSMRSSGIDHRYEFNESRCS